MFKKIQKYIGKEVVAVDVESTGLCPHRNHLFGISLTIKHRGKYISEYEDVRTHDLGKMQQFLKELFAAARKIVNHNMKFDAQMLMTFGVKVPLYKCICSMIRATLIDEHLFKYSLDALGEKYLGMKKTTKVYEELAKEFGGPATRQAQILNLQHATPRIVSPYAKRDTELAYRLWEWQETEIRNQDLDRIDQIEREVFVALVEMEYNGIRIDIDAAEKAKAKINRRVLKMEKELRSIAGNINSNSGKQLKEYFQPEKRDDKWMIYDKTTGKWWPIGKTEGGEPSFATEHLKTLPFREARLMIDIKSGIKTRDTFLGGHILGHEFKGRIYPDIHQNKNDDGGTGTGRLSYTKPALQQIPARNKEIAAEVRPAFLPEEGHGWSYGDLDQHEYRVFGHYSKSPTLLQGYKDNPDLDVHAFVAKLTGIPRNIPKDGGANAKQLNLSIIFCMSDGRVAQVLGLPYTTEKTRSGFTMLVPGDETVEILSKYHKEIPGIKDLQKRIKTKAKSRGYIITILGRHLRFPKGQGVYKSPGLLFQSSSADLNKSNIIRAHGILKQSGTGARLLLNIHDEYSLSIPHGKESLILDVQREIQNREELRVPIRIDFGKPAKNWWLATQKKG